MPKRRSCARCGHSCFDAQNSPRFWECDDVMASYMPFASVRKYIERILKTRMFHANSYGGIGTNHKI